MWNKIKTYLKNNKQVFLLLILPVYFTYFFIAEKLVPSLDGVYIVHAPLDDKIPFVEWFVVFYYVWYVMLATAGLYPLIKGDKGAFVRYLLTIYITFFGSVTFGLLFPNGQNLRPDLTTLGRENVFTHLIAGIYAADTPTNVLPSMHVIGSIACVFSALDSKDFPLWGKIVTAVSAVLVCLSTVFIKQHSVVDGYVGVLVAFVVGAAVYGKRIVCALKNKRLRLSTERNGLLSPAGAIVSAEGKSENAATVVDHSPIPTVENAAAETEKNAATVADHSPIPTVENAAAETEKNAAAPVANPSIAAVSESSAATVSDSSAAENAGDDETET